MPPHPPSCAVAGHLYLSSDNGSTVAAYSLPITSSSAPAFTVTFGAGIEQTELYADSRCRLFVPVTDTESVDVYSLPLKPSSSPAFALTTSQPLPKSVAEDAGGNVYVGDADAGGYIDVYNGQVTSARAPSATISNNGIGADGLVQPYGIAVAPNGDLYASDASAVDQFMPPFTAASAPSATVTPNHNNYDLVVDGTGRIFVGNQSGNGMLDVFTQPFTSSSAAAFSIDVSSTYLFGMAFDGSGNLWIVDENGAIWKILHPITASSTATQVLTGTTGYGIAFGP